jgi:hypothetical protein
MSASEDVVEEPWNAETDESAALEAFTRQPVKTQHTEKI